MYALDVEPTGQWGFFGAGSPQRIEGSGTLSYDLYVFSKHCPSEEQVRSFLSQYPAASISGSLSEPHNLLVDAQATEGWALTVDPPAPFDVEDSPINPDDEELLERLTPQPAWETFIAVPYFRAEKGLQVAFGLAESLARDNDGKIWDPQTEKLT